MDYKKPLFESFGGEWEFYVPKLIPYLTEEQFEELMNNNLRTIDEEIYDVLTASSTYDVSPHPFGIIIRIFLNKKGKKYELATKSSANYILEQICARHNYKIYTETIKNKQTDKEINENKNNVETIERESLIELLEKHIAASMEKDPLVKYYEKRVSKTNKTSKKSLKLQNIHKSTLNTDFNLEVIIKIPMLSYDEILPLKNNIENEINNFLNAIDEVISFIIIFHSYDLD